MTRTAALIVSLAIGVAAVFGLFAASRTVSLGNQSRASVDAQVAKRTQQLNAYEASLRKALGRKTPALPPLATAAAPATSAQAVRVVYHRPPPIIIRQHRTGGDDGYESADGGGADD
jgi:hypothetical protein